MQHDEVIWQVIRHNHCSFMTKITTGIFCRNPYNVTGICNRSSCPLANSRYATIRNHDACFIFQFFVLSSWEKIMTTRRKEKKREARREEKAEKAAALEKSIEKELLERLKRGLYDNIYNYPVKEYNKVLDMEGLQAASEDEDGEEPEIEYVEGYEELEEEDDMEDFGGLVIDKSHADDNVGMDDGDEETIAVDQKRMTTDSQRNFEKDEPGAKLKKKARVLVEVEHEATNERLTEVQ